MESIEEVKQLAAEASSAVRSSRYFDGEHIHHGDFLIVSKGGVLSYIGAYVPAIEGFLNVIDARAGTLLPGLIDAHVHLSGRRSYGMDDRVLNPRDVRVMRAINDCRKLLRAGFTTVRDVGSEIALNLRRGIAAGEIEGPEVFAAGPIISQIGGHADHRYLPVELAENMEGVILAGGVDQCRRAVRMAVRSGSNVIKICTTGGVGSSGDSPHDCHFTDSEVSAIVDEAHRSGLRVAAHAQGKRGILLALRSGVDSIEHGTYLDDECVDEFRKSTAMLVPTVALRDIFRRTLGDDSLPSWRIAKQRSAVDAISEGFRLALDAGIPIAAGSDFTGVYLREHGSNCVEASTMVALGMPNISALRAITLGGAEVIGVCSDRGKISVGMRADLVVVDGDPIDDIQALSRIRYVIKNGHVVVSS